MRDQGHISTVDPVGATGGTTNHLPPGFRADPERPGQYAGNRGDGITGELRNGFQCSSFCPLQDTISPIRTALSAVPLTRIRGILPPPRPDGLRPYFPSPNITSHLLISNFFAYFCIIYYLFAAEFRKNTWQMLCNPI